MEEAGNSGTINAIFDNHTRSWLDLKEIPASDIDFQVSDDRLYMNSQEEHADSLNRYKLAAFQTTLNTSSGLDVYSAAAAKWDFLKDGAEKSLTFIEIFVVRYVYI